MLVRGPVTRVALEGDEAARLRPRFGAMGWAVGHARLRGDEEIDVVRLAPTASMILVPTDRGRLGIAPASEAHLLSALAAAARIQQRLDEVAERARAFMDLPPVGGAEVAPVAPQPAAPPDGRRMLTGIERQAAGRAHGRRTRRGIAGPRPSGWPPSRPSRAWRWPCLLSRRRRLRRRS